METLQSKLFEAASKGHKLLKDDPLILDRISVNCFSETPLHVAELLGHVDFVKEIIKAKPELTSELNFQHSSPLHLASAKGHVDVVKALLSVDHRTCVARDRNGLTPVHLAALKGHVEVMKMLLRAKPEAAQVTVHREENILHLCVKHYQLESLKLLMKTTLGHPRFVNSKDGDGSCRRQTINFLVSVPAFEVNALNLNGMTAVDILTQSRRDVRDLEIEESLKKAGAIGNLEINNNKTTTRAFPSSTNVKKKNKQQDHDWLERKKSALMIVASLLATMAFQVGVNPPGGVWQEDKLVEPGDPTFEPQYAGYSIMSRNFPDFYSIFYMYNTIGFIASLSIILLLMSGLPIRHRFFMWVLMVTTWIAITATAIVYLDSVVMLTPLDGTFASLIIYTIYVWVSLMGLLLVGHTIRLVLKIVRKLRRRLTKIHTPTSSVVRLDNDGV
ncbi:PREDICTED: ankyrin repeat-containing protein At3g12360-like [Erythranthe guttata]|uniref:ankyrin repeat-containing protein At3g12360-like n=1 Tax=Erythranthe guttata TaxID=4155 RepID=UPI00064DD03D|nr:PREDICTED: ankyrin repeat-containing protein At3g12360-like [Erythranthe guttata]|eukprot:XP_012857731.1 PREDICTED: ankyrin repeat-containing protein At3g12360-like [Erythranthe guttata]